MRPLNADTYNIQGVTFKIIEEITSFHFNVELIGLKFQNI